MLDKVMYLTDDRDLPVEDQRALVVFQGGNGDWYLQVARAHGRATEGVRICKSGGAATHCPGLVVAIAEMYRAMAAAERGERRVARSRNDLEEELQAWHARFPTFRYDFGSLHEVGDGDYLEGVDEAAQA